jgi:predicted cupin superfamily sugar epimerase
MGIHQDAFEIRRAHKPVPVAWWFESIMQDNNRIALLGCTIRVSVKRNQLSADVAK